MKKVVDNSFLQKPNTERVKHLGIIAQSSSVFKLFLSPTIVSRNEIMASWRHLLEEGSLIFVKQAPQLIFVAAQMEEHKKAVAYRM